MRAVPSLLGAPAFVQYTARRWDPHADLRTSASGAGGSNGRSWRPPAWLTRTLSRSCACSSWSIFRTELETALGVRQPWLSKLLPKLVMAGWIRVSAPDPGAGAGSRSPRRAARSWRLSYPKLPLPLRTPASGVRSVVRLSSAVSWALTYAPSKAAQCGAIF